MTAYVYSEAARQAARELRDRIQRDLAEGRFAPSAARRDTSADVPCPRPPERAVRARHAQGRRGDL
jgi:hypothetical protein